MRAMLKVELIVGETTVWTKVLPIDIEFDNFRVLKKKERTPY